MPLACLQVAPPLLTLFLHPSCSAWSWSYTFLLGTIFAALLPLIQLVLAYAARTIWCQEWLIAHFAPELYAEVLAERAAIDIFFFAASIMSLLAPAAIKN